MTALPDGFPRQKGTRQKTDDPVLRGRRNKRYGSKRQADARKFFERLTATQARRHGRKANEETWSHLPVRIECKAGMQVGPVCTAYMKAEAQSDQSKAFGDIRPFVYASCPEGMSDFLIVVRASRFEEVVNGLGFFQENEAAIVEREIPGAVVAAPGMPDTSKKESR